MLLPRVTLFEFIYLFFIRHPQERGTSELGIPFLLSLGGQMPLTNRSAPLYQSKYS
ncbi:hypothetical protein THOB06_80073 [Vibrio rotiferianus]|nr:hypothetical protein THOG10_80074 [Vibrio rotiferianus]CAH1595883.1 hypothetical protein THOB06_80073 [Vibrio rotiferianus]